MQSDALMYSLLGLILALAGFGYYAIEVWKAYKEEKKRIEEDFQLSEKYAPEKAVAKVMIYIMIGSTGVIYLFLLLSLLMVFSGENETFKNSIMLSSKFIMLMGAIVLITDVSKIPIAKNAVRDSVYEPKELPKEILSETNLEKRYEMMKEYYEKNGLNMSTFNFGKHIVFLAFLETLIIYSLLIGVLLLVMTGLMSEQPGGFQDIDSGLAASIFLAGVLYVALCIPTIYFTKKASEIPIEGKDFVKKMLTALYGLILPTLGLIIMIYTMLPLLSS